MRKLLIAGMVLLLASCIQVDDFGEYWDKATIDPALEGQWQKINDETDKPDPSHKWTFTLKDGAYEIQTLVKDKADEDGPIYPVKTIAVGPYLFAAKGPEQGTILRYKVSGTTSIWYILNSRPAWAYIRKHYPDQDNIYQGEPDDPPDLPENADDPLKIKVLDDATVKILAEIPDSDLYWDPDTRLEKIK